MTIDPKLWTQEALSKHSVDMRQFIDFRQSTLPNGMRIIEAYNASGLTFTILPDRGMDIWTAHYKGIPLTWISQGSPHPPDFGQTWVQQFNGGLLTTCGLTHVGPPEKDDITGEFRDLHGRYSRLRAQNISIEPTITGKLTASGTVHEATLFGDQLKLTRQYTLSLQNPTIEFRDHVQNVGDVPAPIMLLYHFNVGYPLVSAGTVLHTPNLNVYPRDAEARKGIGTWQDYQQAVPEYREQVFFHHLYQHNGYTTVLLQQGNLGLRLSWHTSFVPYFTQWKNIRQNIYVSGVEPGNCIPEGRNAARRNNRLQYLQAGSEAYYNCTLTILEGESAIQECLNELKELQNAGTPVEGCHLEDYTK
ncbi:MAG: DUF4432 family protein [Anaerolineae bacterium]